MSSYLLSWNPKHFTTGGDGSKQGVLDYKPGEVVRWSCHSKQAVEGDIVYLIKLGKGARGIIAKGTITKASYVDQCWKDASKQRTYIDFRLEEIRHSCSEGLVPQVLLQKSCPEQQWSPQSSGISIKPQYQNLIDELWQDGESKHSLAIYLNWIEQYEKYPHSWFKNYTAMCELGRQIKESNQVEESDLEQIWAKRSNGIASVGQGFMYKKEFEKNKEYLRSVTLDIVNKPTKASYDLLYKEWKTEGQFERTLWSVIRRVFALAAPEQLTSIVGDEYLDALFPLLTEQFEIGIKRSNHWIDDNAILLEATANHIPVEADVIGRNILLWLLYEYSQPNDNASPESELDETLETVGAQTTNDVKSTGMTNKLNQILYGPPGTGKTYVTIQKAVEAAEPTFVATGDTREEIRSSYKEKYDLLAAEGQIRFVTFHQSYGYEEFVEGLKASSDGGNISYDVEDGVFKDI